MVAEASLKITLIEQTFEDLLQAMIDHQRKRVLARAQVLNPHLTEDDILQPHDFPELRLDAQWNYEDGVLAGYISAQMAIRAQLRSMW